MNRIGNIFIIKNTYDINNTKYYELSEDPGYAHVSDCFININ